MISRQLLSNIKTSWTLGEISADQLYLQTDSRKLTSENFFICLKGENFDAFHYIESLVTRPELKVILFEEGADRKTLVQKLHQQRSDLAFICVADSLTALQELAKQRRHEWQARGGKVFSLTGSNGKTTTKEMLAHFLKAIFNDRVLVTKGNLNNHIGVPLTLLELKDEHQVAVVEMGTNHPGEIEVLAKIADPDYGLITNIGAAHIEFLGGLEGVFTEKGALFRSIEANPSEQKLFIINNDDPFLHLLPTDSWIKRASYVNNFKNYFEFKLEDEVLELKCPHVFERHNRMNMMLACSMVISVYPQHREKILKASETFELPKNNRSQVFHVDNCLIYLDAYNANPSSMKASLASFAERCQQEAINFEAVTLVLGDMNEIGSESEHYHREVGTLATKLGFRHLVAIGRFAHYYRDSFGGETQTFSNAAQAKEVIAAAVKNGKGLFIKGSRSLQLESLLDIK